MVNGTDSADLPTQTGLPELVFVDRVICQIDEKHWICRARYIMEKYLGRELKSSEIIHHINEDSFDDRIENLRVMNRSEHCKLHACGQHKHVKNTGEISLPSGGCIIKKMIAGKWGPYLYHVKRVGKKQIWTYLGKYSQLVREKPIGNSAEAVE